MKMELCVGLQNWTSAQDDCNEVKILPERKKEGEERVPCWISTLVALKMPLLFHNPI